MTDYGRPLVVVAWVEVVATAGVAVAVATVATVTERKPVAVEVVVRRAEASTEDEEVSINVVAEVARGWFAVKSLTRVPRRRRWRIGGGACARGHNSLWNVYGTLRGVMGRAQGGMMVAVREQGATRCYDEWARVHKRS